LAELPKDYDWKFFSMPGGKFDSLGLSEEDRAFFFSFVLIIFRYVITLLTQLDTGRTQLNIHEANLDLIINGLRVTIENLGYDEVSRQHGMPFPVNLNAWTTIKNMIIKINGPGVSLDFKSKLKLDPFDVVYFDYTYFAEKYLHYLGIDILNNPEYFYILFDKIPIEGSDQYYFILNTRGFIIDITMMVLDILQFTNRQPKIKKDIFRYFECLIVYLSVYLGYAGAEDLINNSNPRISIINQILSFLQNYYGQNFADYNSGKRFTTPDDFIQTDNIYNIFKQTYKDHDFLKLRNEMKQICLSIFQFEAGIPIVAPVSVISMPPTFEKFNTDYIITINGITDGIQLNQQFYQLQPPFRFKIPNLNTNPNFGIINLMCIEIINNLLQVYPNICRIKNNEGGIEEEGEEGEEEGEEGEEEGEEEEEGLIQILSRIYNPFFKLNLSEAKLIVLTKTYNEIIQNIRESLISKNSKRNIAHFLQDNIEVSEGLESKGGSNYKKLTFLKTRKKSRKKNNKNFIKTRKNNRKTNNRKSRKNKKNRKKNRNSRK
jgi:hypothetical protein